MPGPVLVLAAATLWGTTGTARALGPEGISSIAVAAIRMAGGATLLLYALVRGTSVPMRSIVGFPLLAAVLAMAISQPLFFSGVEHTGVAIGTIVTIGSGPILAGALAWIVRGEAGGIRWAGATAVAMAGTVLLLSGGESAGVDRFGVVLALGAGLAWAVYLVSVKALLDEHPPIFIVGVIFTAAALLLTPWLVTADASWLATGRGIAVALWLAFAATALSYVLFASGLGRTAVGVAATLILAEPLTASVLGIVVLDEPLRVTTVVGAAMIGVALLMLARAPAEPPES